MKILIIDNYDSFTYNLLHALKQFRGVDVVVKRNDEVDIEEPAQYDKIVLSPGPGIPEEAGLMPAVVERYTGVKPFLGVCLGHQAIAERFGAKLRNMHSVFHGVATSITISSSTYLFNELPDVFEVGRYHSWVVEREGLPSCIEVTSVDEEGRIMSLRHKEYDMQGVQFHPESVLTPVGEKILRNWIGH